MMPLNRVETEYLLRADAPFTDPAFDTFCEQLRTGDAP